MKFPFRIYKPSFRYGGEKLYDVVNVIKCINSNHYMVKPIYLILNSDITKYQLSNFIYGQQENKVHWYTNLNKFKLKDYNEFGTLLKQHGFKYNKKTNTFIKQKE